MNDDVILKVENVSKQYRLGLVGTGTISHDFNRFLAKIRGKEDPFLKIGETNDRSKKGESDYVWALKDINFEVKRGEVLGIIGKNGAGKSTLLKILSKVTGPTTGNIKSRGRIASLLEVGTGFHPEMTGKENIFLNGAILGMTKKEIALKLEEIVVFSGCERYIDTPVKRYSRGMKVRLAFAVAAFLEPDILVVDEVLAVGDIEFQKKAIGKMQDISNTDGRTVLFVSHNMAAVKSLCTKGIVLNNGNIVFSGDVNKSIEFYSKLSLNLNTQDSKHFTYSNSISIVSSKLLQKGKLINDNSSILLGSKIEIELEVKINKEISDLSIAMDVENMNSELISHITNEDDGLSFGKLISGETIKIQITTEALLFIPGMYVINLWFGLGHEETIYEVKRFFNFMLEQSDYTKRTKSLPKHSKVYLHTKWKLNEN
jgi:lipopolysaccharide transport system ATP-binding protein